MKLPIKKKWFNQIKSGKKTLEFRDAHITFVCEETGETLRKELKGIGLTHRGEPIERGFVTKAEAKELFEDDVLIIFILKEVK